ncbi:MAG: homoserine O-acetyltransferase, partial [Kiritimatiellae bacterium]|nr:homoserine O-acetyltransferase [Kiritimatiellia bacterium]
VKYLKHNQKFTLENGETLSEIEIAYTTYGKLNKDKSNVVWMCHAFTANSDPVDWWPGMVGEGYFFDPEKYFIVCANILGSCYGSTGPLSINPDTGKPYGSSFPDITIGDIVNVQKLFLETLGIKRLSAVIGGSLGGMQALEWSIRYPEAIDRCICIAAGASLSTQALAFDMVAQDAILSDPNWANGDYYGNEKKHAWGLAHARKIGHITYLSPEIMQKKFGREKTASNKDKASDYLFQVESYLDYKGKQLVERFDANSYLAITKAMDSFDLEETHGDLANAFASVQSKFLLIGLSSDWLFHPEQCVDLASALLGAGKQVSCCTLEAPYGHDAFLIDIENLANTIRAFLPWVSPTKHSNEENGAKVFAATSEHKCICEMVIAKTRVLDLGCGNGDLLTLWKTEKQTSGFGVDINLHNLIQATDKGHDVFQGDLDAGLSIIPDASYGYALFSSTMQQVMKPNAVLHEMLRVAKQGIVTFPNFGNWRNRLMLTLTGRMPKSKALPYEWYETPNIHMSTLKDFVELCRQEDFTILEICCIPGESMIDKLLISLGFCNLGAERIVMRISAQPSDNTTIIPPSKCHSA